MGAAGTVPPHRSRKFGVDLFGFAHCGDVQLGIEEKLNRRERLRLPLPICKEG